MPRPSTRQATLSRAASVAGTGSQPGIQSFARATKPGIAPSQSAKELKSTTTTPLSASPSKKRKLNELENVDCAGPRTTAGKGEGALTRSNTAIASLSSSTVAGEQTPSKTLRISELALDTPRSGHYAAPSPSPSPLKRSKTESVRPKRVEFERTLLTPSTPSRRSRGRNAKSVVKEEVAPVLDTRPACVHELLNLHLAFLRALTIHMAHNGPSTPADLKEFLPSVERIWKKRKVVLKDLQRLVWIREQGAETTGPSHRIANYGLGRVCLERVNQSTDRSTRMDESLLQEQFEQTMDLLWEKALDAVNGDESQVNFMETLGLSTVHESLTPFTAFRKGQQRLQDLKGGVIKLKTEMLRAETKGETPSSKPVDATTNRRKGLLDRIKDKQLRQSKLPPPPSKETLSRRAAAQRVEEVAEVLAMLRPTGYVGSGPSAVVAAQRTPFRVQTIIENVRNSTRNPIAERDVELCIELLAREDVAGQWVNLVTVNQVKSVVLKSCADVHPKEIGARACQLDIE